MPHETSAKVDGQSIFSLIYDLLLNPPGGLRPPPAAGDTPPRAAGGRGEFNSIQFMPPALGRRKIPRRAPTCARAAPNRRARDQSHAVLAGHRRRDRARRRVCRVARRDAAQVDAKSRRIKPRRGRGKIYWNHSLHACAEHHPRRWRLLCVPAPLHRLGRVPAPVPALFYLLPVADGRRDRAAPHLSSAAVGGAARRADAA